MCCFVCLFVLSLLVVSLFACLFVLVCSCLLVVMFFVCLFMCAQHERRPFHELWLPQRGRRVVVVQ